jgi:hypothetical protein
LEKRLPEKAVKRIRAATTRSISMFSETTQKKKNQEESKNINRFAGEESSESGAGLPDWWMVTRGGVGSR